MAKKNLLRLSNRLKFVKIYKSLAVEGGQDDYLFWMNAQNIFFFSCLK